MKRMPRCSNALLAIWTLIASGGISIEHCHAGGDKAHSHHIGLCPVNKPSHSDHAVRHMHLVLFGVEVSEIPMDQPQSTNDSSVEPIQLVSPTGDGNGPTWHFPDAAIPLPHTVVLDLTDSMTSPQPVDTPRLCPVASHCTSGVNRC